MEVVQKGPYRFRIEPEEAMRVPGVVFASRALLPDPMADESLLQVANVATLPRVRRRLVRVARRALGVRIPDRWWPAAGLLLVTGVSCYSTIGIQDHR